MSRWPHDDTAALIAFYGDPRRSDFASNNLVLVRPPWQMTYEGRPIRGVQVHRKCADSLKAVFDDIAEQVGHDWTRLPSGAVAFSGSYNYRPVRGSSRLSCHAFGAAIDMDAEHNGMNSRGDKGTMSPIVINAFKRQGWYWGGDFHSRQDPMHFQAANEGSPAVALLEDINPVSEAQAEELPPMTDGHSQLEESTKPAATIEDIPPNAFDSAVKELPKTMLKSKIGWAQVLAFFGIGGYGAQKVDATAFDQIKAFVTSPGFLLILVSICLALTLYWRWKDHGRGSDA